MKTITSSLKLKIFCSALLLLTGVIGWTMVREQSFSKPRKRNRAEMAKDSEFMNKLADVAKKYESLTSEYLFAGTINVDNGAAPEENMDHATIVFSKRDSLYYYRVGELEMFNLDTVFIQVDHSGKNILISRSKHAEDPEFFNLAKMTTHVKEEGYKISAEKRGTDDIISFKNPDHFTCKEYALTYDATTLDVHGYYLRLSNPEESENAEKDKVIDIRVSAWNKESNFDEYLVKAGVRREPDGGWSLDKRYAGYEQIRL